MVSCRIETETRDLTRNIGQKGFLWAQHVSRIRREKHHIQLTGHKECGIDQREIRQLAFVVVPNLPSQVEPQEESYAGTEGETKRVQVACNSTKYLLFMFRPRMFKWPEKEVLKVGLSRPQR